MLSRKAVRPYLGRANHFMLSSIQTLRLNVGQKDRLIRVSRGAIEFLANCLSIGLQLGFGFFLRSGDSCVHLRFDVCSRDHNQAARTVV